MPHVRKDSGDTPEQIYKCLHCPFPICVNCHNGKSKHAGLNHRYNEEIILPYFRGEKSEIQIAAEMGMNKQTVSKWVQKFRKEHSDGGI